MTITIELSFYPLGITHIAEVIVIHLRDTDLVFDDVTISASPK
ncbi:MAG TPA: hypothetical protein VGM98_04620 [Schlesneria sp.]|jgi:hypothetical protein